MDIATYLKNAVNAQRQEKLKLSDQLSLGELILKVEGAYKGQTKVIYDFEYLFPTDIKSWRGSYDELALNFTTYWKDGKDVNPMNPLDFLQMLRKCIGETFIGYKGGEFVMGKNTPIWVANYGNSGNTAVIDVIHDDYNIILVTAYREY